LAELVGKSPDGLAADLADRRVVSVDGTVGLESPRSGWASWIVRLDDGGTLSLAPGVPLPPGRQRLYYLPRSRWVVHGEARPEQWQDYRALVLQAQQLGLAEVDALRAGQLPPRHRALLRSRARVWWIPALLWLGWLIGASVAGAAITWQALVVLGLLGLWGVRRLVPFYADLARGTVTFVDGPVHINVVLGRKQAGYALVVGDAWFRLPEAAGSDSELMPVAVQECVPCRLYHAPTSGLFVAIEPLI
jgi:hypothetical protein